jgi:hypothetical protein
VQQTWSLQPGQQIAGYQIRGGLGDVSIDMDGRDVHAPFDGQVQPHQDQCVVFSSAEVPAYLLRMCGLQSPQLGDVQQGDVIGTAELLNFAALRRQPDGTWALIEPSTSLIERSLAQSPN